MPRNLCHPRPEHPLTRHLPRRMPRGIPRSSTLWPLVLAGVSIVCAAAEAWWMIGPVR